MSERTRMIVCPSSMEKWSLKAQLVVVIRKSVGLLLNQEINKQMLCTTLGRCVANLTVHTFGMPEDNILEG